VATRPADGPEPYGAYPTNQGANVSVVKINVLEVPEGRGEVLEQRFAARAGEVEKVDGFESFDLLRPTEGTDRYLVVTKWRDDDSFQAWMNSQAFQKGHAQSGGSDRSASGGPSHGEGERPSGPAATGSELWGFEVVTSATGSQA
jgi:heme oxygenase (mycobilin-producing)